MTPLQAKCHACVGGTSACEDTSILQAGMHVVVGTPGRVYDMLRRCALRADSIRMFVLDEADEMLSHCIKDQIYDIFSCCLPSCRCVESSPCTVLHSVDLPCFTFALPCYIRSAFHNL